MFPASFSFFRASLTIELRQLSLKFRFPFSSPFSLERNPTLCSVNFIITTKGDHSQFPFCYYSAFNTHERTHMRKTKTFFLAHVRQTNSQAHAYSLTYNCKHLQMFRRITSSPPFLKGPIPSRHKPILNTL